MLSVVERDRWGNVSILPVSEKLRMIYATYMRNNSDDDQHDGHVFLQGDDADAFIKSLSTKNRNNVIEGFRVRVRMEEWEYATMLGFDAQKLMYRR